MIKILKTDVKEFSHIIQIADVHIKLNSRHAEYRDVFKKLYDDIDKSPASTCVAVLGDMFHSKVSLSPECIQVAAEFLTELANRRPTILIAGNHDAILSNKSRLDSITPVVNALNHPNLFYLPETGLYALGNLLINNMSIFDTPDKYIMGNDIPKIYRNQYKHVIALFHGPIDKAVSDTGYVVNNPSIMLPMFDKHHIVLLGDIHKAQTLQEYDGVDKPIVRYSGSCIAQNHGETLKGHGYSLWDLSNYTYTHKELKNEYGYFTIEIHNGLLTTSLKEIPKKTRLRIQCFDTVASEVKTVIAMVKGVSQVIETAYMRMDKKVDKQDLIKIGKDVNISNLTNLDYQNQLIAKFLSEKLQVNSQSKMDGILSINKHLNTLIKKDDFVRNLKFRLIKFEWDNMFAYGEDNVIDFTKINGTYGIFGPNKTGKTSIFSAIIFCLYDKFDRGNKGQSVLNTEKTSFRCKLEFEISGCHYFIERKGTTTRTGNVKVDVEFWKMENGVEEKLNGTARRNTNDIIRDYVGTYEDFILTCAFFQTAKNNVSFIDLGNSERKDLISQFLGLNVFDRLHDVAGERNKELNALLKSHKDKNYPHEIKQYQDLQTTAISVFSQTSAEIGSIKTQIQDLNAQIVLETGNLIKLETSVPTDLAGLNADATSISKKISEKMAEIEKETSKKTEIENSLKPIGKEISKLEKSDVVGNYKKYKLVLDKISTLKHQIEIKKTEIRGRLEKVEKLKDHKYDPNCQFCINNEFVIDAKQAGIQLQVDKVDSTKMMDELRRLTTELNGYGTIEDSHDKYNKHLKSQNEINETLNKSKEKIQKQNTELEVLNRSKTSIQSKIDLYNKNKSDVEKNIKTNSVIASYKTAISKLETSLKIKNDVVIDISSKLGSYKNNISTLEQTLDTIKGLEAESDLYKIYMESIGRDGIPYQIVCNIVPELEKEINLILTQIVDFTIQLETDGKNIVPYISYEHGKWPIEGTSGYERFVASIAIRVALTELSTLPKCSGLFLDEGFSTLDAEHLPLMYTLFSYLKNQFDFIILISHSEAMKDCVDNSIEVKKEGNFSKVIFE